MCVCKNNKKEIEKQKIEGRFYKKTLCNQILRDLEFPALRIYLIQLPDFTSKEMKAHTFQRICFMS